MTRWLQAAKSTTDVGTKPTELTEPCSDPVLSDKSVLSQRQRAVADRCAPSVVSPQPTVRGKSTLYDVCNLTGKPRTWTGKVVALDEWRRLSGWERTGPAGRFWCGVCCAWVTQDGSCRVPGCWNRVDTG